MVDTLSVGYVLVYKRKEKKQDTCVEPFSSLSGLFSSLARGLKRTFGYADMSIEQSYSYFEKHYKWMCNNPLPTVSSDWLSLGLKFMTMYYSPFLKDRVRLLTLRETMSKQKRGASPCGLWSKMGYVEKRELLDSPLFYEHMLNVLDMIEKRVHVRFPCSVNRKYEIRKVDPISHVKKDTRLFKGNSIEVVLIEDMFLHFVDSILLSLAKNSFLRHKGWFLGFSKFGGNWHRLGKKIFSFLFQETFDVHKMDAYTLIELLTIVLKFILFFHSDYSKASQIFEFLYRNVVEYLALLDDGLILMMLGSNASGRRGTSFTNTFIVLMILVLYHFIYTQNVEGESKLIFHDDRIYVGVSGDNFFVAQSIHVKYCEGLYAFFQMFNYTIESRGKGEKMEFNSLHFSTTSVNGKVWFVPLPVDISKRLSVLLLATDSDMCSNPVLYFQMAANIRLDGYWSDTVRTVCDTVMRKLYPMVPPGQRQSFHSPKFVEDLYLGCEQDWFGL